MKQIKRKEEQTHFFFLQQSFLNAQWHRSGTEHTNNPAGKISPLSSQHEALGPLCLLNVMCNADRPPASVASHVGLELNDGIISYLLFVYTYANKHVWQSVSMMHTFLCGLLWAWGSDYTSA